MSYVSEVKSIAIQILDKLNELDTQKEITIISENSTYKLENAISSNCEEEVIVYD